MKVIWICNIVLPQYSKHYGFNPSQMGGWMPSVLSLLEHESETEVVLCFGIKDEHRRKDFEAEGHRVYSYNGQIDSLPIDECFVQEFTRVFEKENPDVIHIWGTEYKHSYYAVKAAEELGIADRVLIDLQGIVSFIAKHYLDGVDFNLVNKLFGKNYNSTLVEEKDDFANQAVLEQYNLSHVFNVTGRTDWDYACSKSINSALKYYRNERVLRDVFYENHGCWSYDSCRKHRLFLSAVSYALKGFHLFVEVLGLLKIDYPDLEVVIAGENLFEYDSEGKRSEYADYVEDLINLYDLKKHIRFTGVINASEMVDNLLKANVFVACSTVENSCNSLCEAMILGVPSVATYVGGLPSVIEHKKTGFLYQANAAYMGAEYIREIFDNPKLAKQLSENASAVALERHDRKGVVKNLMEIYKEIK